MNDPTATPHGLTTSGVQHVKTRAEFEQALANAKGPVAALFVQEGCEHCDEDEKALAELKAKCGAENFTALQVNSSASDELDKLADDWDIEGTPTLFYAPSAERMTPKKAKEVDASQLKRRLKCARTPRSK